MKAILSFILLILITSITVQAQRKIEYLDRGLVAVKTSGGVFLSWRVLGTDPTGMGFNIYRGSTKVNTSVITGATNITDASGTTSSTYTVKPVVNGVEQSVGGSANVWGSNGLEIQLDRPTSSSCTYTPNDCSVGDVDGDGQWEIFVKWDPSNSKDNSQSGKTDKVYIDCYELTGKKLWRIDLGYNIRAGAHYTQYLVGDYDCDGKAEIAFKTAPGTKGGDGKYLSVGPAANDDDGAVYRNSKGYILTGPEYLTIFNGETGKEMSTVNYNPPRGTVKSWGDSYGGRVDRFLATNAYLDGKKPSMVFNRGYYTRMAIAAYDWDGSTLKQRWYYNAPTKGEGGYGQGNHNWTCGDVDGDGKDEIIHGACAIDDNGKLMYRTGFGHGDAIHMGDMDVNNPGLEVWDVHEDSPYGYDLHDAKTGKILWSAKSAVDNGRGNAGDVDAGSPGYEMWSAANYNTYSSKGSVLSSSRPSYNFRIYWDGDLQDELLDNNRIDKWNPSTSKSNNLVTFNAYSCNTTKATPNLSADIIGDWREEVILHDNASKLYIYTTTIPTTHKLYTLMHDPNYRNAISWQNTAYNQPPHLGFFLGNGADKAPKPNIEMVTTLVNDKPTVSITSPTNNSAYPFLSDITFTSTAKDNDGKIVSVSYYNGGTLIGSSSTSPYSVTWKGATTGTSTISAIVTDDKGGTGSAFVTVKVNPGKLIYEYDNSGDLDYTNVNSWTPKIVPSDLDTAVIRTGEAQVKGDILSPVYVEPNGILRMVGFYTIPDVYLLGGTLKVYTSHLDYGMDGTVHVMKSSSLFCGSNDTVGCNFDGTFTGSANLTKIKMGVMFLNNSSPNYSGDWFVTEGTLKASCSHSTGTGSITINTACTLAIDTIGGITGCDTLTIVDGGKLIIDATVDSVKFAKFGDKMLPKGTYNSADYPSYISGVGSLVVTVGEARTSQITHVYEYDNSGDLSWTNTNSWIPNDLPQAIDSAIIRIGECQIKGDVTSLVIVEPNGVLRMIGYYSIPKVVLKGGALLVNTSNATYGLNATVVVENASTIMAGANPVTIFNFGGTFTGSGALTKTSLGTLLLNSASKNYSGNWIISEGILQIKAAHSVGTGSVTILSGAVVSNEVTGGLAGCDTLLIENGGIIALNGTIDTVSYLKVDGVGVVSGVYTASDFPSFIQGAGSIVVLNTIDTATAVLPPFKMKDVQLDAIPNPMIETGIIRFSSPMKGVHKLVIVDNSGVEKSTVILSENDGVVQWNRLSITETGVFTAMLYSGSKLIARVNFYQ